MRITKTPKKIGKKRAGKANVLLLVLDPKNKGRGKVQNSRFVHKSRKIVLGLKSTG